MEREFEENDYFCRLVYTDFYKRLDKFFKKKYDEQVDNNRFNPDRCQYRWTRQLKCFANRMLEIVNLNKVFDFLRKIFCSESKPEDGEEVKEALIVNISEDDDVK